MIIILFFLFVRWLDFEESYFTTKTELKAYALDHSALNVSTSEVTIAFRLVSPDPDIDLNMDKYVRGEFFRHIDHFKEYKHNNGSDTHINRTICNYTNYLPN